MLDISSTLTAKSDQLNADDLSAVPVVCQITRAVRGPSPEQPVDLHLTGRQPWRPCKTMRRVLAAAWGTDAEQWVGRWVALYRDDAVSFGGAAVGGVRVAALSHIPGPMIVRFNASKGKKAEHRIAVLTAPAPAETEADRFFAALVKIGIDPAQAREFFAVQDLDIGAANPEQLGQVYRRMVAGGDLRAEYDRGMSGGAA